MNGTLAQPAPQLVRSGLAQCLALVLLASTTAAVLAQPPTPKDAPKTTQSADEKAALDAFRAGKVEDALKSLQAAYKANPTMSPPRVVLSRWFLDAEKGPQARVLLEQAAAEDPDHPDVYLTNALYALREGRITDAVLSCQAALDKAGSPRWDAAAKKRFQREARLGLVAALDRRGDYAAARAQLVALLEVDPKNPQLRQQLARVSFLLNRPDDAFADFQTAYRDDPTLDPPELTMALLWGERNEFTKADESFQKATAAHPTNARAQREYARFLLARGRIDDAKARLAAAQKLEPTARDTRAVAGLLARYTKDYAAAVQIFEELVREHPTFGFATANLALCLAESTDVNQKRRAVELAEVFARQNPRNPEAYAVLGYALYKSGRMSDAERAVLAAAGLGTLSPDAAYFLGRILADTGRVEEAHTAIKLAVESKDAFVFRKDAEALLPELAKKLPAKKP